MGTQATAQAANAHITTPTRLTGAEIVWATLVGEGVTDVFGYPGGAILPVYDALRAIGYAERKKMHGLVLEAIDLLLKKRGAPSMAELLRRQQGQ